MRIGSAEQLREHLGGRLRPAYLVAGDEPLLVMEAVDQVRKAALASGCSERLVFDVVSGFDWADWRMQARSYGLFASRRLIELRLASAKLTIDGAEAVSGFVADPGDDVLLIQAPEWNRTAEALPWVAAIERAGVVAIQRALRAEELPAWLRVRARAASVSAWARTQCWNSSRGSKATCSRRSRN
jgi:DNA polymerase-3 subunit delta